MALHAKRQYRAERHYVYEYDLTEGGVNLTAKDKRTGRIVYTSFRKFRAKP